MGYMENRQTLLLAGWKVQGEPEDEVWTHERCKGDTFTFEQALRRYISGIDRRTLAMHLKKGDLILQRGVMPLRVLSVDTTPAGITVVGVESEAGFDSRLYAHVQVIDIDRPAYEVMA